MKPAALTCCGLHTLRPCRFSAYAIVTATGTLSPRPWARNAIIPTYNEAENITLLLPRLAELYPNPDLLFLIVDDESPDGTGRLVREFAATDARVHLPEGSKRGLGAAYVRGIRHAIELSIISKLLINNYWTFADRELTGRRRIRGLKFNVVSLALAVSYGSFLLSVLLPRVDVRRRSAHAKITSSCRTVMIWS